MIEQTETKHITHGLSRGRVILATAGTMLALLLAALDQTIVGTAIPRIVAELHGLDRLAWVTTAYLVTSTTMTPKLAPTGWDRCRKRSPARRQPSLSNKAAV